MSQMAGSICDFSTPFKCTAPQTVAFDDVPSVTYGGPPRQCELPDGSCRVTTKGLCAANGGLPVPDSAHCPTVAFNTAVEMLGMLFSGGQRSLLETLGAPGRDAGYGRQDLPGFGTAGSGMYHPASVGDFGHHGHGAAPASASASASAPSTHGVREVVVHNNTDYDFPAITVTSKDHVAAKPVHTHGHKSYHLETSGPMDDNMVLALTAPHDKHSVHLLNLGSGKAVGLSSSLDRPVVVSMEHTPHASRLALHLNH